MSKVICFRVSESDYDRLIIRAIKRELKPTEVGKYCQWFIINDLHPIKPLREALQNKQGVAVALISDKILTNEDNTQELKYVKVED